jgi:elongator complex protein 5
MYIYMRFNTHINNQCLMFVQLLALVVGAVSDGRWPGRSVTIAAFAEPPSAYHYLLNRIGNRSIVHYLDCWTNPYGWPTTALSEKKQQQSSRQLPATPGAAVLPLLQSPPKGLDELLQHVSAQPKTLLFIDSMSPLLDVFGLPAVCSLLTKLRNNAVNTVFLLHSDLHSQHEISTLCYGSACLAELVPANERPEHCVQPHGRLSLKFRRKSGAVKTEGLDYRINNNKTGVEFLPSVSTAASVPSSKPAAAPATVTAAPLATTGSAPSAAATSAMNGLGQQLAGGMRLDVSAEEAAARSQVQLPYEHQGQGQLYASGGDFRDYLPEAAGGRRRGTGRLGHILYVRDSDSEDPDSDEDPDDDLDV